jgi:hypothetical protein
MNDNTLAQMVDLTRSRYYGKYRGLVTDNADPNQQGRVQVRVPGVLGDLLSWAMPCVPYAGKNAGHYFIPEVEAGVWVEFEGGDISFPIWTGTFWADNEAPLNEKSNAPDPNVKVLRTKSGLIVSIDDTAQVIAISDDSAGNIITLEVSDGLIKLKGLTKCVVEAPAIELVEGATHPLVFGDDLLNYLNQVCMIFQSHTHPGEMALGVLPVTPAPPVPPFPKPSPSMLSTKVKTG